MLSRGLSSWLTPLTAAVLVVCAPAAAAADDAALLRVFLTDGTALVSYGEPAHIGDRIVFSMPTGATSDPPLQLVNLPAGRVNWERTNRYAQAARAARYTETQAELDYAALSNRMILALDQLTSTGDSSRRLAIAENARKMLAAWPAAHYNYRLSEVRQMLSLLDEAIADLRVATGAGRFDLSFSAFADPPAVTEPLAPPPTAQETIEQLLSVARVVDSAAERTMLLETTLASLDRDATMLPSAWREKTRAAVKAQFDNERRLDKAYQSMSARIIVLAERHARAADVLSLTKLVERVRLDDRALGGQRPETVDALVAAVETRLDAARRFRLARDTWTLRAPEFGRYRAAIKAPLDQFAGMEPALEGIKALAGSSPSSLTLIEQGVARILNQARSIVPPAEFRSAHALLISAVQLAGNAAQIRFQAAVSGDITRAWDASSAAAGALMLSARARTDMQSLLRPPQLR